MTTLQEALARPLRLFAYKDGIDPSLTGWDILPLWFTNVLTAERMRYYHGIKGTLVIRLNITINPLLNGSRIWAITRVPEPAPEEGQDLSTYYATNGYTTNINIGQCGMFLARQLYQRPIKAIVTPWGPNIIEIRVPFLHNRDWYYKSANSGLGHVILSTAPMSPMEKMDGTAITAATAPDYQVYAWMEDAEVFSFSTFQANAENPYRAASGAVAKASSFAKKLGFSTAPVDAARKLGDTVASALGYSKPAMPTTGALENRVFSELVSFNGLFGGYVMSDDVRDGFPVSLPIDTPNTDETDIAYLGSIDGLISPTMNSDGDYTSFRVVWNNTAAANTVLASYVDSVTAGLATLPNTPYVATPGDHIARPFLYYSYEKTIYTFDVICNSYYKGALVMTFDPVRSSVHSPGQVVSIAPYVLSKTVVVSGPTRVEFEVPWMQRTPYLRQYASTPASAFAANVRTTNGVVTLQVSSPLVCGFSETSKCNIILSKRYVGLKLYDYRPELVDNVSLQPNYADLQSDGMSCFGSELKNLSQIFKIASPMWIKPNITNPAAADTTLYYNLLVPLSPWTCSTLAPPKASPGNTTNPTLVLASHPLEYFSRMYLAKSGTIRSAISAPDSFAWSSSGSCWITKKVSSVPTASIGSTTMFDYSIQKTCREPFEAERGMRIHFETAPSSVGWNPASSWPTFRNTRPTMCSAIRCMIPRSAYARYPGAFRIDYSGGDSYNVKSFQGVPPVWYMTVAGFSAGIPVPKGTLLLDEPPQLTLVRSVCDNTEFLTHDEDKSEPCDGDHPALVEGTSLVERKD